MARTKIRNYWSVDEVKDFINEYFKEYHDEVIDYLIKEVNKMLDKNFKTIDELNEFDIHGSYYGGFGLDCSWVRVKTFNKDQYREWVLDNGKYNAEVWGIRCPYNTQSTTCKEIQIKKALNDLGLNDQYYASVRLD